MVNSSSIDNRSRLSSHPNPQPHKSFRTCSLLDAVLLQTTTTFHSLHTLPINTMGRTRARRSNSPEEFPMLKTLGLMAVKIKGDGK